MKQIEPFSMIKSQFSSHPYYSGVGAVAAVAAMAATLLEKKKKIASLNINNY